MAEKKSTKTKTKSKAKATTKTRAEVKERVKEKRESVNKPSAVPLKAVAPEATVLRRGKGMGGHKVQTISEYQKEKAEEAKEK